MAAMNSPNFYYFVAISCQRSSSLGKSSVCPHQAQYFTSVPHSWSKLIASHFGVWMLGCWHSAVKFMVVAQIGRNSITVVTVPSTFLRYQLL